MCSILRPSENGPKIEEKVLITFLHEDRKKVGMRNINCQKNYFTK
jgi:hypothetical protein